jgi:hypothetical protein
MVLGMSKQFFYVHLKFTPKSVSLAAPIGSPHEIVVEVPRGLLKQRQADLVGRGFTEEAIALDLARDVALKTASPFPAIGEHQHLVLTAPGSEFGCFHCCCLS